MSSGAGLEDGGGRIWRFSPVSDGGAGSGDSRGAGKTPRPTCHREKASLVAVGKFFGSKSFIAMALLWIVASFSDGCFGDDGGRRQTAASSACGILRTYV